jgi:hypothetical protein
VSSDHDPNSLDVKRKREVRAALTRNIRRAAATLDARSEYWWKIARAAWKNNIFRASLSDHCSRGCAG